MRLTINVSLTSPQTFKKEMLTPPPTTSCYQKTASCELKKKEETSTTQTRQSFLVCGNAAHMFAITEYFIHVHLFVIKKHIVFNTVYSFNSFII